MMTTGDFSYHVLRTARILSALSGGSDSLSPEALEEASKALSSIDGITDEDRFLIAAAARLLLDNKPIDLDHCKEYRGHVDNTVGRMYVHTATKGVIYV